VASVVQGSPEPTSQHPPLFPLLIAGLDKLGVNGLQHQRDAFCLLQATTVVLVGLLGRRFGGARVGLIAAGLGAVYPNFLTLDGMAMVESLYVPLVALVLLAADRIVERPTAGRAAMLGAAVGLATLARTEALLLVPLLAIALLVRQRRENLRVIAVMTLAAMLVLSPWLGRNWAVQDKFPLLSTNGGLTAMVANCNSAYYGEVGFFDARCSLVCYRDRNDELRHSACGTRVARRYALDHRGRVPVVVAARIARTWSVYAPNHDLTYAQFGGRNYTVGLVGMLLFYAVCVLAALGAVLLWRERRPFLVLLLPLVMVTFSTAVTFGFSRYRVAAEVPLVVLAAVGLDALAFRRRQVAALVRRRAT
jgi:4-amino-4-deoxy-L-arabinose transferase-like glycosyltransferase